MEKPSAEWVGWPGRCRWKALTSTCGLGPWAGRVALSTCSATGNCPVTGDRQPIDRSGLRMRLPAFVGEDDQSAPGGSAVHDPQGRCGSVFGEQPLATAEDDRMHV